MRARWPRLILALTLIVAAGWAAAETNIPGPTLGGKQVWADVHALGQWRIQHNVVTDHYRLLDGDDWRQAWGSYDDCAQALEKARRERGVAFADRKLVILVHGLGRAGGMFGDLEKALHEGGHQTLAITYPSTRESVARHGDHLERLLTTLDGIERVSFVTHSMGALVVRETLGRPSVKALPVTFDRLVMIAPPNRGSAIARILKDNTVYGWLTTETGRDLTPDHANALPTPDIDFAIIAGGRGDGKGYVPFVEGDDDGVVGVEETKLDGAKDFLVVPAPHGLVDNHPLTLSAVLSFLGGGGFDHASQ